MLSSLAHKPQLSAAKLSYSYPAQNVEGRRARIAFSCSWERIITMREAFGFIVCLAMVG